MAYLRARRSIKLGPGVRLNLNKRSMGVTLGPRGAHYSFNTSGRRQASVGIPGTGLSYIDVRSGGRRARSATYEPEPVYAPPEPVGPPKAGLFAPHYEKAFANGVRAYADGNGDQAYVYLTDAASTDAKHRSVADDLLAGLVCSELGKLDEAVGHLEKVVGSDQPLPDALMVKYAPQMALTMEVNETLSIRVELGSIAASLLLADAYARLDRVEEAIGVLQQVADLDDHPYVVLQLCLLYQRVEDWDDLVHVAADVRNVDDLTLLIRLFQAEAMEEKGLDEAALEVYRDTLRSKKRDPEFLKVARYERAKLYCKLGKKAQATKDLSRIYADDPDYKDVGELLAAAKDARV